MDQKRLDAMGQFAVDLHVHTALSPCGDSRMTPPNIVDKFVCEGIDLIAICDHNSARNVAAVQAAAGDRLAIIAGMEITVAEEVHVLGLFPDVATAEQVGERLSEALPDQSPLTLSFGEQPILSPEGEILDYERKALGVPVALNLAEVVHLVKEHGGLAIASHIDRSIHSVLSRFGELPADVPFDALEVSVAGRRNGAPGHYASFGLPVVHSSDSHHLANIGTARTWMWMREPTFAALAETLREARER